MNTYGNLGKAEFYINGWLAFGKKVREMIKVNDKSKLTKTMEAKMEENSDLEKVR